MKNNPSTAAVAIIASLALWAVIIAVVVFVYRTYLRDRIDTIPVLGAVHRFFADIRERGRIERNRRNTLAQQRQAEAAQWAAAQTQFAATGYPPQPYSVPVPNAQQPVYDYPPVPPQMAEQPAYSVPVRPTTEQPQQAAEPRTATVPPVADDLDDLFDRKLDD